MKGETVWAAAAVASLLPFAAGAATTVSGTLSTSGWQASYTCTGTPTCTGTYTGTAKGSSCTNTSPVFGDTVTITGLDPAHPSSSGNITFTKAITDNTGIGTCSYGPANVTLTGTYSATSDGTTGTMTATLSDGAGGSIGVQGKFVAGTPSPIRVSGTISASDAQAWVRLGFSCTGTPTCTGAYTFTEQDTGCSNSYTYTDTIVFTGFDVSHPGSFSGTLIHYSNSHSTILSNGTCAYSLSDDNAHSIPYSGNWDGTNGTMVAQFIESGGTFPVPGTFNVAGVAAPPSFPMTVTSNITATNANASAQVQPRAQDAGKTESIFVFAYAPQSTVLAAGKRLPWSGSIPAQLADGPDPCVLAQVNSNGQLTGASASSLTAATSGVLNAQGQSVSILNNVATPNVAGATMYVGYGANSNAMFANGTYQGAVNVPGPSQCTTNLATTATPVSPGALTGLWWNASESGWGIHFTQRGSNVFAAWYTYDSAGTLQVTFSNANAASMTYTVAGQTRTNVALTRQPLASGTTDPAVNFSDIWWNANESGWGAAMAQQYGITFLAWYVYDASGKPTWLVATCTMSGNVGQGTLYRTTGPAFGPSFDPNRVTATQAGNVTVEFTDPNNATINYTVDGVAGMKAVTRQIF